MGALRAGAWLVVAASLLARAASAAEITVLEGVRVESPACPIAPLSLPAFVDSLRVELAGRPRAAGTTRVTLAIEPCDTSTARVRVGVSNDATGAAAERDVGLEDIAALARPRALALAVAELVRSEAPPPAPAPPPPPPAPPPAEGPALERGVAVDALVAFYPSRDTVAWGGRFSGTLARGRWTGALFVEAALGRHDYAVGDVALQTFAAGVVVGPRFRVRQLELVPALVGALGSARIQGHASEPGVAERSDSGFVVALRARLAVAGPITRMAALRVFVEGGWMARGFDSTVDGARAAGASGATLVAGLGLAF